MKKQKFYQVSAYDFILAVIILFFSFSIFLPHKNTGINKIKEALIYKDNRLVKKTGLSQKEVFTIDKMAIEIKNGHVQVLESDCPGKTCVHAGPILDTMQTIVCVPNKILIRIIEENKAKDYDVVSY